MISGVGFGGRSPFFLEFFLHNSQLGHALITCCSVECSPTPEKSPTVRGLSAVVPQSSISIVLPFGKYEYQTIPMGLCNSPGIFQEKMSELIDGLAFVRTYIDDLLCLTKGSFTDHLEKIEFVLQRLQKAGLKVNVTKSFFARSQLEYLGYWITQTGIKPVYDKVKVVLKIAEPKNQKEL